MGTIQRTASALGCLILCALAPAVAQRGAPPPRDGAQPVEVRGTAFIGGIVFDDTTAAPLRRATVTARNVDVAGAASISTSRISVTDDAGRFGFANLPAVRFSLSVAKPAYITTAYGAKAPRGQGLVVALTEDQRITDLVVKMPRGA